MTRTYIAAPIGADEAHERRSNCREALLFAQFVEGLDETPVTFAFEAVLRGWLDDSAPHDRAVGIFIDHILLRRCVRMRLLPGVVSPGMQKEIDLAREVGIPVLVGLTDEEYAG